MKCQSFFIGSPIQVAEEGCCRHFGGEYGNVHGDTSDNQSWRAAAFVALVHGVSCRTDGGRDRGIGGGWCCQHVEEGRVPTLVAGRTVAAGGRSVSAGRTSEAAGRTSEAVDGGIGPSTPCSVSAKECQWVACHATG